MSDLRYQSGFGNEFATEAVPGALPKGQNAPQNASAGSLHGAVQRHGVHRARGTEPAHLDLPHSAFGDARALRRNRESTLMRSGPFDEVPTPPNQLRWDPLPIPSEPTDFVDGMVTLGGNGDPAMQAGVAIHLYAANRVHGRTASSTTPTARC